MWFYGVAKLKRNINISTMPSANRCWIEFNCAGQNFSGIAAATDGGKKKLYYAKDTDLSNDPDKLHVWTEGEGWVDNSYRGISYGSDPHKLDCGEAWDSTFATWLYDNTEYYLRDGTVGEYHGPNRIHCATWVFPETFEYRWQRDVASHATFSISFSSGGSRYTSMKIQKDLGSTYGFDLYYGSTRVYHSYNGWVDPKYRIIRCDTLATSDSVGLCAFIMGAASENVIIDYNGYKATGRVGQKITIPCAGKKLNSSIKICAGPHVGTIKVFYNNTLTLTHKVPTTMGTYNDITYTDRTGEDQAITIPNKGLPMKGNIVVELHGN